MASEAYAKGDSIIVHGISTNSKAFFDEDEEGFWLDTGNLSKQDKAASKSIAWYQVVTTEILSRI